MGKPAKQMQATVPNFDIPEFSFGRKVTVQPLPEAKTTIPNTFTVHDLIKTLKKDIDATRAAHDNKGKKEKE